jgi:hypothetical protein
VTDANGNPAACKITIDRDLGKISARLAGIPENQSFDLWFVKNSTEPGKTVAPETGDTIQWVGTFDTMDGTALDKDIGSLVFFDLDMVVVTRTGQNPTTKRALVGGRTLFEKRYFRALDHAAMDTVSGPLDNTVETNDPLVQRGAQLFNSETFGGNGRVCASCHPMGNNLTIDAKFIASLPSSDPLFVFERDPTLAQLEDGPLLRTRALFRENVDGLASPPVLRGANHTFALGTTNDMSAVRNGLPIAPPDQALGWGGDGAPGRGTLNDFAFGAIVQHATKNLDRKPGRDFRIPTQQELDALEAFQLFTGRQKLVNVSALRFRDGAAEQGRLLASLDGQGKCANCHFDIQGAGLNANFNFDTGVSKRPSNPTLPADDGFKHPTDPNNQSHPGDGFNAPPLIEAADTAPFFHNNSAATVEDAIRHYTTQEFAQSGGATFISGGDKIPIALSDDQIAKIGAFLRELNAAENLRQIKKRVLFVRNNRSTGNTAILGFAIRDAQDALNELAEKNLNAAVRHELATIKLTLSNAQAEADANRPAIMDNAIVWIDLARNDLLSSNPNGDF